MLRSHVLLAVALVLIAAFDGRAADGPHTLRNDDACDIGLAPAATLLLPYFRVDVDRITGPNTLFTITNTGERAQVARVTLWTDFAYPVLTFDLYLTGYDVQSINLYDVIARGIIGGDRGTGVDVSPVGAEAKRNPLLDRSNCGELPHRIDPALVTQLKSAFIEGEVPGCPTAGHAHENAVGYATIDVVGNCAPGRGPTDPLYFSQDIRYDNVLIGDSIVVNAGDGFAQATPMVHIRAIPEGGTPRTRLPGPLPRLERTFYGRFQDPSDPHLDARQPLPSRFAARWINAGRATFGTTFQVWRDGVTGRDASCAAYLQNGGMVAVESVAFDEDENGQGVPDPQIIVLPIGDEKIRLPATSLFQAGDDDILPQQLFHENLGGWVYLNLDDGEDDDGRGAHQNWVTVRMEGEERYSVAFDAAWLGNGCTPAAPVSRFTEDGSNTLPGPADDVNP
ncbi:MAG TPA: hypothetical protein VGF28_14730 [Thermoanaerobaculia bacterium]|jgi:hypothetical protein